MDSKIEEILEGNSNSCENENQDQIINNVIKLLNYYKNIKQYFKSSLELIDNKKNKNILEKKILELDEFYRLNNEQNKLKEYDIINTLKSKYDIDKNEFNKLNVIIDFYNKYILKKNDNQNKFYKFNDIEKFIFDYQSILNKIIERKKELEKINTRYNILKYKYDTNFNVNKEYYSYQKENSNTINQIETQIETLLIKYDNLLKELIKKNEEIINIKV